MRGARLNNSGWQMMVWIIPAYAGSTTAAAMGLTADRDHPRVCGEHVNEANRIKWPTGSSPRMRGALT